MTLDELAKRHCTCDLLNGYHCTIHQDVAQVHLDHYRKLVATINSAFLRAYPHPAIISDSVDEAILCKRVEMLLDDLLCTRVNSRNFNKALADLDRKHRGIRNYWWEFWRRDGRKG